MFPPQNIGVPIIYGIGLILQENSDNYKTFASSGDYLPYKVPRCI
jgi:hypothetical protein